MSFGSAVALAIERIVEPVEGMHRAIAGRWFSAVGPVGRPVEMAHDVTSHGVYQAIRLAGTALGVGLDVGNAVGPSTTDRTQAFINGIWGDRLERHDRRLSIPMGLRDRNGVAVAPGAEMAAAFPNATGHLVVLVHGFINTERCWYGTDNRDGLLEALDAHPDLTPLLLRYNTGQQVSANGALLAELIETVHDDWPVPVESISLVGHSMGGLVARAACQTAQERGHDWVAVASDLITLGAPHLGTPLEKLTNGLAGGLSVTRETRPLAEFLESRSRGIKDLRFGTTWGNDGSPETLPAGIDHHFVAGVVTSDPGHPIGILMGDLIVRKDSATGGQRLEPTNVLVVGGLRHNELIHEASVTARAMEWLDPGPAVDD